MRVHMYLLTVVLIAGNLVGCTMERQAPAEAAEQAGAASQLVADPDPATSADGCAIYACEYVNSVGCEGFATATIQGLCSTRARNNCIANCGANTGCEFGWIDCFLERPVPLPGS